MLSPLEYDPELVAGIGLITARWSAPERQLAELLGTVMVVKSAGPDSYYALANFSQRIAVVQTAIISTLANTKHRKIAKALFTKVGRIWKTRNVLIHSHYVYLFEYDNGTRSALTGIPKGSLGEKSKIPRAVLTIGPVTLKSSPPIDRPMTAVPQLKVIQEGPAYIKNDKGKAEFCFVNKGTFANHAEQLRRRGRQIMLLARAIEDGRVPVRRSPSRGKPQSRSRPDHQ